MKLALLSIIFSLLTGCGAIATRQPIYDPAKDAILDKRLVGTWYSRQMVWEFTQWRGGLWMRDVTPGCDNQSPAQPWPVDLVRLGKHEFLFMAFGPFADTAGIGTPLFPCWRMDFSDGGNTLKISLLNTVALAEYFQDHPGVMKYEPIKDGPFYHSLQIDTTRPATQPDEKNETTTQPTTKKVVQNMILTDEPKRIRKFLIDHSEDPMFFVEQGVLRRVTGS
jgi:hypothetical protein